MTFHKTFPNDADGTEEGEESALDRFVKGKTKLATSLAHLMHAVFDGEYDEDLLALLSQEKIHQVLNSPEETLDYDAFFAFLPSPTLFLGFARQRALKQHCIPRYDDLKKRPFLKQLMDFCHSTESNATVVSAADEGTGASSLRQLVRRISAGGDDEDGSAAARREAERQQAWKQASASRKRHVQFVVWKDATQAQSQVNGNAVLRNFKAEPGESHRLFILCADLLGEADAKPWLQILDKQPSQFKADARPGSLAKIEPVVVLLVSHLAANCP